MGRKTNLMGSSYVSGGIDEKTRTRWVDAIPTFGKEMSELDDEELGKLVRAGSRVLRHAKFTLNKLNQEGGKNSWTRNMTKQKNKTIAQIEVIEPFLAKAEAEANKREREGEQEEPEVRETTVFPRPRTWDEAKEAMKESPEIQVDMSQNVTKEHMEAAMDLCKDADVAVEFTEPAGANLYELFCDTPQKELYELAYKGLEAGKSQISPEELANLREDAKVANELCEELRLELAKRKEYVEELRSGKKKAEVELKKLRRVLKGIQTEANNTVNRLRKYTEDKETT